MHLPIKTAALLLPAAALSLLAAPAGASGALELTGAPTSANGLNARVFARGPEAAFFNPALLPELAATTQAGLFVLVTHGDISLAARPAGADVPASVYEGQIRSSDGTTSRLPYRPLPTANLPQARSDTLARDAVAYATLGVVRPLYEDRLTLGFYAILPIRSFQEQNAFYPDEREQYFSNRLQFELLGDRLSLTTFAVALGGRIARWLSVGAGVDVTIGTVAETAVHVPDAGDQREILINPRIDVESTFAPYFAVVTHPSRWLRLAATLHLESSSTTDGENRIRFWNYVYPDGEDAVRQIYSLSLGHEPLRFGVGAVVSGPPVEAPSGRGNRSHDVRAPAPGSASAPGSAAASAPGVTTAPAPPPAWEIGVRAQLTQWSTYVDRHAEAPLDTWSNTLSVGVGGAVIVRDRRIAADVAFTPSPVPDQTGRTNYVDNPRLAADLSFETPVSLFGADFGIGVFVQGQILIRREVEKSSSAAHPVVDEVPDNAVNIVNGAPLEGVAGLQTNNPGYPGFSSEGWLAGAGFVVRLPQ